MAKISYAGIFALVIIIMSVSMANVEGACSNDLYLIHCEEPHCRLVCAGRYDGGRGHCAIKGIDEVCECIHDKDCNGSHS
ncbi:hypothetical protein PIB30_044168 [Stylosanthes scabra]|uniref:Defensin-like protein n=1 Tax=Stylosanthes scabra TaxID=79078 RepID=A0ABU6XGP9_9FABA|nr:hypothetical protein [Stylosanthes scabra]